MDCKSCEWKKAMSNPKAGKKIPGKANGKCTRPEGFCEAVTGQGDTIVVGGTDESFDITMHLSPEEKSQFEQCETIIRKNLNTFIEVGEALAEIRDNRLYRERYKTFEQYCKQEWDFSRSHAHNQIKGYEAIHNIKMLTMVNKNECDQDDKTIEMDQIDGIHQTVILPQNERQTRPLTKLDNPDDQVKAWNMVLDQLSEGKKLTSFLIGQAVKEVKGETLEKTVAKTKQTAGQTQLLANIFKRQYQVLLDIVYEERRKEWTTSKKGEVVKYLKELLKVAETDD